MTISQPKHQKNTAVTTIQQRIIGVTAAQNQRARKTLTLTNAPTATFAGIPRTDVVKDYTE